MSRGPRLSERLSISPRQPALAKSAKRAIMGDDGGANGRLIVIRQTMLPGHPAHDLADRRIVHAADPGKEVVLDLEVETADVPRQPSVVSREVGGRVHLMEPPIGRHAAAVIG